MKKTFIYSAMLVLFLVSCSSDNNGDPIEDHGRLVTREEFGKDWAFTVDKGYVYSIGHAAIFKANGTEYQLNGVAATRGYKPIDPIWKDNPNIPGAKIYIGTFIDLALNNPIKNESSR